MTINRHVLIPVDHSEHSEHALRWAINYVLRENDQVTLLHVYDVNKMFLYGRIPELSEKLTAIDEKARNNGEILLDRLMSICRDYPEKKLKVTAKLLSGEIEDMISQVCQKENVDLVLVGSRDLGTLKRAFINSISDYCVRHCPCPVIVVKASAIYNKQE
jgi:nucleotide-binding universal stress UspA family protein